MIKKLLLKLFMPSAESLASYAANAFCDLVNSSEKADTIAKYSQLSEKCTDVVKQMSVVLGDGKVDPQEKEAIRQKLQPLFAKMIDMIKEKL